MVTPLLVALACTTPTGLSGAPDTRLYEMRTYFAAPGKLNALNARFRNHTLRLFRKHGITNIGYWVPVDNPERKLIYILAFPDRAARDKAFAEFGTDPEWQQAARESEKDGKLVEKIDSVFMTATDFSPAIRPRRSSSPRLFELRIYKTNSGKLADLHARFRDHTIGLFRKHGMTNFGYWTPTETAQGAENTLIYFLAHKDRESATKSWEAFRADPDWNRAREASEKAGPILSEPPTAVSCTPTDYSPTR